MFFFFSSFLLESFLLYPPQTSNLPPFILRNILSTLISPLPSYVFTSSFLSLHLFLLKSPPSMFLLIMMRYIEQIKELSKNLPNNEESKEDLNIEKGILFSSFSFFLPLLSLSPYVLSQKVRVGLRLSSVSDDV